MGHHGGNFARGNMANRASEQQSRGEGNTMTEEDEAFEQIEKAQGWRKREIAMQQVTRIGQEIEEMQRNEVLEEVAKQVHNFKAFEKDTMDSFAAYIRSMKR